MTQLYALRKRKRLSERAVAEKAGVARETVRACERSWRHVKIESLEVFAKIYDRQVLLALLPLEPVASELSTVSVAWEVCKDGFDSWKIHFMNLVDHFRRTADLRLVMLPPIARLDPRLRALMASIVDTLCEESGLETPDWARREHFLDKPWFLSAAHSLTASALVESPAAFRRNNIFVLSNFLQRA